MTHNKTQMIISFIAAAFSLYRSIHYAQIENIEASFGFGIAAIWAIFNGLTLIENAKLSKK
jgi:hypothetical protein